MGALCIEMSTGELQLAARHMISLIAPKSSTRWTLNRSVRFYGGRGWLPPTRRLPQEKGMFHDRGFATKLRSLICYRLKLGLRRDLEVGASRSLFRFDAAIGQRS
jgi:hypothetical protein